MNNRQIKTLISFIVGVYLTLVVFNNTVNYQANFQFVSMVVKMEDTFSPELNDWRGTHHPVVHHFLYIFIILWECLIAGLLFFGAYQMWTNIRAEKSDFNRSKTWASTGLALGVVLWFFVFISVAGEWFLMWQSSQWNAQENAFALTTCFLLFLIFLGQDND